MGGTDKPLVSAVITTYERPTLVKRAVESVLGQTYEPLEIVVVEDGSDSAVDRWIEGEVEREVDYVCHADNRGLAAARNTGLDRANGDYVAYLDDDDEWKPTRIEAQVETLRNLARSERESLGVLYCGAEVRGVDGGTQAYISPTNHGDLRTEIMEKGASTISSSMLFPKSALEAVGGFDESLPSSIDHDIWMALATRGYEAHALDEPLVIAHAENERGMMSDTSTRIEGVRLYVEKWKPTYQEWYGETEGAAHAERYFANTIARLAARNVREGRRGEALTAYRAIFEYSHQTGYNLAVSGKLLLKQYNLYGLLRAPVVLWRQATARLRQHE